jgi:signal transduction histidine kinase
MARQVAHEIKNPLTPIKLSLQHLQRLRREPPPNFGYVLQKNLDLVLTEIGRLERIAGEFSRFGAASRTTLPIEPAPALLEVVELYAHQSGGLRFELDVRGRPAPVLADPDGLKKVLVNLLENAREAMNGGARPDEGGGGDGLVRVELDYDASPAHALVRVRDTGPGIPPEDLERLFEPYFSTKTRGTGLGLAIARRLVESWGGSIMARNWEGGAEVLLWLGKSPTALDTTEGPS